MDMNCLGGLGGIKMQRNDMSDGARIIGMIKRVLFKLCPHLKPRN